MASFMIFAPHSRSRIRFHYDLRGKHQNEIRKLPAGIVHMAEKQVTSVAKDVVMVAAVVKDHKR